MPAHVRGATSLSFLAALVVTPLRVDAACRLLALIAALPSMGCATTTPRIVGKVGGADIPIAPDMPLAPMENSADVLRSVCRSYLELGSYADHGTVAERFAGAPEKVTFFATRMDGPGEFHFEVNNFGGLGITATLVNGKLITTRFQHPDMPLDGWLRSVSGVTSLASVMVPPLLAKDAMDVSPVCSMESSSSREARQEMIDGADGYRVEVTYRKQAFTLWVDKKYRLLRRWATTFHTANGSLTDVGSYVVDLHVTAGSPQPTVVANSPSSPPSVPARLPSEAPPAP